jgi:hypothetical protein
MDGVPQPCIDLQFRSTWNGKAQIQTNDCLEYRWIDKRSLALVHVFGLRPIIFCLAARLVPHAMRFPGLSLPYPLRHGHYELHFSNAPWLALLSAAVQTPIVRRQ